MATIGFFSNNTVYTRIIQWFESSKINHCAIGLTKDGKQYWLQAGISGVQLVDRGWLNGLCYEFEVLPNITDELSLAEKKIGEPYAFLTIFGFIFVMIARWIGIGLKNPFREKSAEVCSQFIIDIDINNLIPEFKNIDPASTNPDDLFRICLNGASFRKL